MKKVIYTVITGGYDRLLKPLKITQGWDYICFTDDRDMMDDFWEIRYFEDPQLDPAKLSRKPKILAHKFLPEYDISIYHDPNLLATESLEGFVREIGPCGISAKRHPRRENIDQEREKIIELGKADPNLVNRQVDFYIGQGMPLVPGQLCENGILYRTHNDPKVIEICETWWKEILQWSHRDQLSLPYVLWKLDFRMRKYSHHLSNNYFMPTNHIDKNRETRIWPATPYGPNLQYGRAINEFCRMIPDDDDWIMIRDLDTMPLPRKDGSERPEFMDQVRMVVERYPKTGIFGCMTNRVGLPWQLHNGKISKDPDILHHQDIAEDRWREFGTRCMKLDMPVAGFFLMFRKSTWRQFPFREGDIIGEDSIYFDWDFCIRVLARKLPIRIMLGVYLFHFYWFDRDNVKNVKHIQRQESFFCA